MAGPSSYPNGHLNSFESAWPRWSGWGSEDSSDWFLEPHLSCTPSIPNHGSRAAHEYFSAVADPYKGDPLSTLPFCYLQVFDFGPSCWRIECHVYRCSSGSSSFDLERRFHSLGLRGESVVYQFADWFCYSQFFGLSQRSNNFMIAQPLIDYDDLVPCFWFPH